MRTTTTTAGLLAGAALAGGLLPPPAGAATGSCDEGVLGYAISAPVADQETGGHAVVLGLEPVRRTVTFRVAEGTGCVVEPGDRWSVASAWFSAAGTYDGTAPSLTDRVLVALPQADAYAGVHPVVVTLDGVTDSNDVHVKRRTRWRAAGVGPEEPVPTCGVTELRAKGLLERASWSAGTWQPFPGQTVALLWSAGQTWTHDLEQEDQRAATTDAAGRVRLVVRPPYDATWAFHLPAGPTWGHADARRDLVDCTPR